MTYENNDGYPEFKVLDHVRISKYKNIFAKSFNLKLPEEDFVTKKVKTLFRGHLCNVSLVCKQNRLIWDVVAMYQLVPK